MPPQRDRVVAAPVEDVSLSFQNALRAKGWPCKVAKEGKTIQISGRIQEKTSGTFTVVLADKKSVSGPGTSIRVEGAQKTHPELVELLAAVEQSAAKKPRS